MEWIIRKAKETFPAAAEPSNGSGHASGDGPDKNTKLTGAVNVNSRDFNGGDQTTFAITSLTTNTRDSLLSIPSSSSSILSSVNSLNSSSSTSLSPVSPTASASNSVEYLSADNSKHTHNYPALSMISSISSSSSSNLVNSNPRTYISSKSSISSNSNQITNNYRQQGVSLSSASSGPTLTARSSSLRSKIESKITDAAKHVTSFVNLNGRAPVLNGSTTQNNSGDTNAPPNKKTQIDDVPRCCLLFTKSADASNSFGSDDAGERISLLWQAYHESKNSIESEKSMLVSGNSAALDILLSYVVAYNSKFGGNLF